MYREADGPREPRAPRIASAATPAGALPPPHPRRPPGRHRVTRDIRPGALPPSPTQAATRASRKATPMQSILRDNHPPDIPRDRVVDNLRIHGVWVVETGCH